VSGYLTIYFMYETLSHLHLTLFKKFRLSIGKSKFYVVFKAGDKCNIMSMFDCNVVFGISISIIHCKFSLFSVGISYIDLANPD